MLDHLAEYEFEPQVTTVLEEGFVPFERADVTQLLDAQIKTTEWLKEIGAADDEEIISQAQQAQAQEAFSQVTTNATTAKSAVAQLTTPPAIARIVGMLTAYEWRFVEEAQKLRSMAVAKIVDETDHPDARIRLKALELLGKVTEVGLFTDRIEIKKAELSDDELNNKIREKLAQLQKTVEVEAKERAVRNQDAEDVALLDNKVESGNADS